LDVSTVELSQGVYLEPFTPRPGRRFIAQAQATKFFTSGGYLYLDTPPQDGDTVLLCYHAMHALPSSEDDAVTVMTIPAEDEELIRLYVRAKVAEQMRLSQSASDRERQSATTTRCSPSTPP
jgi:hypothetical protein